MTAVAAMGVVYLLCRPVILGATEAGELPVVEQVVAGAASISRSGLTMRVDQTSGKAILNWQTFNIGSGASVEFHQPDASSVALNRVLTASQSRIDGSLTANGMVFLINPAGIIFGSSASVNAGGMVASTLAIDDGEFMAGNYRFTRNGSTASVINQGSVTTANAGLVALLAPAVHNEGIIEARLGSVLLGSGETITLTRGADALYSIAVDPLTVSALVSNGGIIRADGGTVIMRASTADGLAGSVVNTGEVRARTIAEREGRILLVGDMESGSAEIAGTLDASAPNGGDGGFIETSAARVRVADGTIVTRLAPYGHAGTWLIDPDGFTIAASGGDMTGDAVELALAGGNFAILSTNGTGSDGNINVNDTIDWNANTLTLTATGNININAQMTARVAAKLVMNTGANSTVNCNLTSTGFTGRINFPGRSGTGFLTINGSDYTVIQNINELQNMQVDLSGKYALGSNIDASITSGWNNGDGFIPIAYSDVFTPTDYFTGIFDGLGHTIDRLTIHHADSFYVGLFGRADSAALGNVGLTNGSVTGQETIGALAGFIRNNSSIKNAYNTNNVTGESVSVGGLVGFASSNSIIGNSYNTGAISGSDDVGGIVGNASSNSSVSNSYNTGVISGKDYVGGITGKLQISSSISESENRGNVQGSGLYIGGIAGYAYNTSRIDNSYNSGRITGSQHVGGVTGDISDSRITYSHNTGEVRGNLDYIGGIAGYSSSTTFEYIDNTGIVSGSANVGGIVGNATVHSSLSNGYNSGDISSTGNAVGGIVGRSFNLTSIESMINHGNIHGNNQVGGLVGFADTSTITKSSNFGEVSGTDAVGGLAGRLNPSATITGSDNWGLVNGSKNVGGIAGQLAATGSITDSKNSGNVTGTSDYTGGIVGYSLGRISNTTNSATVDGVRYVGGIAGQLGATGSITNSENSGNVTGTSDYTGGIVGYSLGSISNATNSATVDGIRYVGGIAGQLGATGSITNSENSGNVTGTSDYTGGIVGSSAGSISNATNSAKVDGVRYVGGVVGQLTGTATVTEASNRGSISGTSYVGGLAGDTATSTVIRRSVNQGSVVGGQSVGGVTGRSAGQITDSYNMGSVAGESEVGGVAGTSSGNVTNAFNAGSITGATLVGGFIGNFTGGSLTACFWDTQTSGVSGGIGNGSTVSGLTGLESSRMKLLNTFSDPGWDISTIYGGSSVWRIYDTDTYPILRWTMTKWTTDSFTFRDESKVYDTLRFFGGTCTPGSLPDQAYIGGTAQGAKNAGTYAITLYSWIYDLDVDPGTLTVIPAPLTITADDRVKIYGRRVIFNGTEFTSVGLVGNERLDRVTLSSRGASLTAGVLFSPYRITPSAPVGPDFDPRNYDITYIDGMLTVIVIDNVGNILNYTEKERGKWSLSLDPLRVKYLPLLGPSQTGTATQVIKL